MERSAFFLIMPFNTIEGGFISKLNRVVESFQAHVVEIPKNRMEIFKKVELLKSQLDDANNLITINEQGMEQIFEQLCGLNEEGGCSIIVDYKLYCLKDKSVYHNMSLLMP